LNRAQSHLLSHRSSTYVLGTPYVIFTDLFNVSFITSNEVQLFRAAYAKYGASRYAGLTIGNEVEYNSVERIFLHTHLKHFNSHQVNDSTGNIMAKVYDVRGYLGSVGVTTPVSTVHTWVRIRNEPALCGADFVAANAQ